MATTVCVLDTCILIDLRHAGVLGKLALLSQQFVTTDLWQMDGLSSVSLNDVAEAGIRVLQAEPDMVARALSLSLQDRTLSVVDIFSLLLAEREHAMLVTGDRPLRRIAEDRGIEVHGVLWLSDEMVRATVLSPTAAIAALKRMLSGGARLPLWAVDDQIATWESYHGNEAS